MTEDAPRDRDPGRLQTGGPSVADAIALLGPDAALRWHVRAMNGERELERCRTAVASSAAGESTADDASVVARFGLDPFVDARRTPRPTITLVEPWWVVDGFVVAAGDYEVFAADGDETMVMTPLGPATLLEPSGGVQPSVGPGYMSLDDDDKPSSGV